MADEKISALPEATAAANNNLLAMVQGGVTSRISVENIFKTALVNIPDDTINSAKMEFANGSVPGTAIVDGGIATLQLEDNAVDSAKLADNSSVAVVDEAINLPRPGAYVGQLGYAEDTDLVYVWDNDNWQPIKAAGNVSKITTKAEGLFHLQVTTDSNDNSVDIEAVVEEAKIPKQFIAGPTDNSGEATYRSIVSNDLPRATSSEAGVVQVGGQGLRMNSNKIEIDNDLDKPSSTPFLVTYDSKGLILGGRAIERDDVPLATTSAPGAAQAGTGLKVGSQGTLNHINTGRSGKFVNVTVDNEGHVTAGSQQLEADNLPDIPASKLKGTISADNIAPDTIDGTKLANNSTVKFGGATNSGKVVGFPVPDYSGQLFYDTTNKELYISVSNEKTSYEAITQVSGNLVLAGTYDANESKMVSVTAEGQLRSFVANQDLPTPTESNKNYYVVVAVAGTPTGNAGAPDVALAPPDILLSLGNNAHFKVIKSSSTLSTIDAKNVTFDNATNGFGSNDVDGALNELNIKKAPKETPTFEGDVKIEAGNIILKYTTDSESKSATIKPTTADNDVNYTLPSVVTTPGVTTNVDIITSGDSKSVTGGMIDDDAITNAKIFDSSADPATGIEVDKFKPGLAGNILVSYTDGDKVKVDFKDSITPTNITVSGNVIAEGSVNLFTDDVSLLSGLKFQNTPGENEDTHFTRLALEGDPTDDHTITIPNRTSTLALLGVKQTYRAAQISEPVLINSTDANAGRLNFSAGNNFHISMLSSLNLDVPDNLTLGQSGVIRVEQDTDGDNALTFNEVFKFSSGNIPDNTRTGEAVDLFGYYVDHVDTNDATKNRISVVPVLNTTRIA